MNTEEGNKLIASFMGAEFVNITRISTWKYNGKYWSADPDTEPSLKFHSSWDWLMPVVEKMNNICSENGRELSNHSSDQEHLDNPLDNPKHWKSWSYHYIHLSTNIKSVWQSLVGSIQWYNITKPPTQC